jgi:hypothetical protein
MSLMQLSNRRQTQRQPPPPQKQQQQQQQRIQVHRLNKATPALQHHQQHCTMTMTPKQWQSSIHLHNKSGIEW